MRKLKIAILNDYQNVVRTLGAFSLIKDHETTVWNDYVGDIDVLVDRLRDSEVIVPIRERTRFTAGLLNRLPNLKLISQYGHVPHIDVEACTRNGIIVSSAIRSGPSYSTVEFIWGLILSAMRHIPFEVQQLKKGVWQSTIGYGLNGRTLGIYGYGRLGSRVAGIGAAFGMKILVWGRQGSLARAKADGFPTATSVERLFSGSDVLSLHLRLNDQTAGLVGYEELSLMKPTALLVNTSRAELIRPGDLVRALSEGRPGMAAVDGYEREPLENPDDPLLRLPNVVCTPHIAYVEMDNYEIGYGYAFEQIAAFANGTPINVLNAEVLPSSVK